MTVKGPRVRDYTDQERRLDVEIDGAPVYEVLLALFVFSDEGELGEYEVGADWFDVARDRASSELLEALDELQPSAEIWLSLVGIAYDLPDKTVAGLIDHLATIEPTRLRAQLLASSWSEAARNASPEDLASAATGDSATLEKLLPADCAKHSSLRRLLAGAGEDMKRTLVEVIRRFDDEVLLERAETARVIARDAGEKEAMVPTMPADRLVEVATNGVTFSLQPDVSGIVLVPSVVLRPWVIITERRTKHIFCYPVAEHSITADPSAPPQWLVQFYKALGDERRLRMLSMLKESPASLTELAERLDLAKSTIHHHLRLLRAAGLVRITIGDDKEYSLRRDAVPEASAMLEAYLAEAPATIADLDS